MKLEISPSGRAACRGCKKPIPKGEVRFAESYTMPGSDTVAYRYFHTACAVAKMATELKQAIEAYEGELPERETLLAAIANAPKKTGKDRPLPHADRAPTSRARCTQCGEPIEKGTLRIGVQRDAEPGSFTRGPSYMHVGCGRAWARDSDLDETEWVEKVVENSAFEADETARLREEITPA